MIILPLQLSDDTSSYVLLVVLEDDNISRVKAYDPAEIVLDKLGEPWVRMRLASVQIAYASAEEMKRIGAIGRRDDLLAFIQKTLYRGWKFRPERGDDDLPYQRPAKN